MAIGDICSRFGLKKCEQLLRALRSDIFEGGKDVQVPTRLANVSFDVVEETGDLARFLAQNRRSTQWQNSRSIQRPGDPGPAADQIDLTPVVGMCVHGRQNESQYREKMLAWRCFAIEQMLPK